MVLVYLHTYTNPLFCRMIRKKNKPFEIGDRIIERIPNGKKKRIGEILFVQEGAKNRKLELLQLNTHDLSPLRKGNLELKFFRLSEDRCKRLNEWKYLKKPTFQIGDIIKYSKNARIRYGRIICFLNPDGLYSDSNEKGYNGKDLIECVEIKGKIGLPRKLDSSGEVSRFVIGPGHAKICEISPMDDMGGVRFKT
jgi:hypothetical protein